MFVAANEWVLDRTESYLVVIHLLSYYCSTDGHESISLSQFRAGGSNPYRELGDGEGWEIVTRKGIEMRTRPATWGQAQVELEREGTFVHLMSDNLTRDQVLTIAAGLRPAPATSSF